MVRTTFPSALNVAQIDFTTTTRYNMIPFYHNTIYCMILLAAVWNLIRNTRLIVMIIMSS